MAIHKPRRGDCADRLTVVLLKLEKTLGIEKDAVVGRGAEKLSSEPAVVTWLAELKFCIGELPLGEKGVVEMLNQLFYLNRRIWEGEDRLRRQDRVYATDDPCGQWRDDAELARMIRDLNDERSRLVGELNGFNDKVGRD